MKSTTMMITIVMMTLVAINHASAEMVDIGMGQMTQSEFVALKAKVQGQSPESHPAVSTPLTYTERYGMLEMTPGDFESLRKKVIAQNTGNDAKPVLAEVQMVDIGTGKMPQNEFMTLKRMVEGVQLFRCCHDLAIAQP